MIGDCVEVFMDDFSIFGDDFASCLDNLTKILKWCIKVNLVLSWEKSHFMVRDGIILGHRISKNGLEVDRAKSEIISHLSRSDHSWVTLASIGDLYAISQKLHGL